jgi:hypothetical protein
MPEVAQDLQPKHVIEYEPVMDVVNLARLQRPVGPYHPTTPHSRRRADASSDSLSFPGTTMASPTPPQPPAIPEDAESTDLPITLAASVVLTSLPRDGRAALDAALHPKPTKGHSVPTAHPHGQIQLTLWGL